MSDVIYVTLFGNSTVKIYRKYKIACFTVQLAHEIDLDTDRLEVEH